MKQATSILAAAGLISLANAHGYITTPKPRLPGTAMSSACGEQIYNNQKSDRAGNVQGELQIGAGQEDYDEEACHIWLCKGYQFDDNKENVQQYSAGQTVDFVVDIIAPHTGVANVSVVDTSSNSVIGQPLKSWAKNYASTETGITEDDTNFSVTIPENLDSKCSEAGACVLQWYWFAESIDQTYESCVDFTVGGSGSGSSGSGSGSSSGSGASTTSAPAQTQSAVNKEVPDVPTTLSTATRPAETATGTAQATAVPTAGSSDEQVNWLSSIFKAVTSRE